jgi:hypothetical protein
VLDFIGQATGITGPFSPPPSANELAGASLAGAGPVDVVAFPQARTRRRR